MALIQATEGLNRTKRLTNRNLYQRLSWVSLGKSRSWDFSDLISMLALSYDRSLEIELEMEIEIGIDIEIDIEIETEIEIDIHR